MTKYILVTGGVISGIGKGVIASSSAVLLKMYGLRVTSIKIDPYLNIDAGTLSPLDHGEVFVLDDGGEVDLDLGNYERFIDVSLTKEHNITTGKIYREVIERERRGDFAGKTVQVVPHITDAIQDWIERVAQVPVDASGYAPDICIVELGGTVGDIESAPFIEAMRQFHNRVGPTNMALVHVSLVPVVGSVGEQKTKPTQASVCLLRGAGLSPDIIACRSTKPLDKSVKEKISMFCHVTPERVLGIHDCTSVYHVPLLLGKQGLLRTFETCLKLRPLLEKRMEREGADVVAASSRALKNKWTQLTTRLEEATTPLCVAVVGKYTDLQDAYLSMKKSLEHAALAASCNLKIEWIEATDLEDETCAEYKNSWARLRSAAGVIVPGGFGIRGIEGKILATRFARENRVPFLGLCLGMQVAVIEFARTICGLSEANSEEFSADAGLNDPSKHVIINMPEIPTDQLGGTMRLGARITVFDDSKMLAEHPKSLGSIVQALHGGVKTITERHRHRYEVNPNSIDMLEKAGMYFVGRDETGARMEVLELPSNVHPFFVGTQYHPEYKTRPLKPSPPFFGFILAAIGILESWKENHKSLSPTLKIQKDSIGRYDSEFDLAMEL